MSGRVTWRNSIVFPEKKEIKSKQETWLRAIAWADVAPAPSLSHQVLPLDTLQQLQQQPAGQLRGHPERLLDGQPQLVVHLLQQAGLAVLAGVPVEEIFAERTPVFPTYFSWLMFLGTSFLLYCKYLTRVKKKTSPYLCCNTWWEGKNKNANARACIPNRSHLAWKRSKFPPYFSFRFLPNRSRPLGSRQQKEVEKGRRERVGDETSSSLSSPGVRSFHRKKGGWLHHISQREREEREGEGEGEGERGPPDFFWEPFYMWRRQREREKAPPALLPYFIFLVRVCIQSYHSRTSIYSNWQINRGGHLRSKSRSGHFHTSFPKICMRCFFSIWG